MSEIDKTMFEDESTIHFGGDGDGGIDVLAGFDSDADAGAADTTADAPAEVAAEDTAEPAQPEDSGNEAPTTEQTETAEEEAAPSPLRFKAKINHKEEDVSLNPDDLPTIYQKAMNQDRAVQRANAAKETADKYKGYVSGLAGLAGSLGFEGDTPEAAIEAMIAGITENTKTAQVSKMVADGATEEVAAFIVDQRMKEARASAPQNVQTEDVDDGEADTAEEAGAEQEANEAPSPEQFADDLQALLARRPDIGKDGQPFPDEVLSAYMNGENLTVAYLDYEAKNNAAEKAELERQNRIFKQNQESAARAPVKGVSGSGDTGGKADPWIAGFDDKYW